MYSALSLGQSSDYETFKAAILQAYELVPEAYRQQFRKLRKTESQSHVELAREQACLFDQCCGSQDVRDLEDLKKLILLEQFKNWLHERVATYNTFMSTRISLLRKLQFWQMSLC